MSARSQRFPIGPVERLHAVLALTALAGSWLLVSRGFAIGLALGAVLEAVNFRSLRRASESVLGGEAAGAAAGAVMGFGLRFVLLAAAVGIALHAGIHPVGLVVGLSLIVPAAVIGAWTVRPRPDPNAEAIPADDPSWERWDAWRAKEVEPPEDDDEVVVEEDP